jgi:uncharacterized protein
MGLAQVRGWPLWFLFCASFVGCAARLQGADSQESRVASAHYLGPVLDVHVHLEETPNSFGVGRLADLPAALSELKKLPPGSRLGLVTVAPRGDLEKMRAQNNAVLAAVQSYPELFWAVASVNPWDGEGALGEIDRLAAAGVRMLKLHPNSQQFDVAAPEVLIIVARAAAHNMIILFDGYSPFDADETGKFLMLAVQQPSARFILAHMGGPRFLDMMIFAMAQKFAWYPRNIWFDLSVVAGMFTRSPFQEQLVFVCRSIGLDRVMLGSDYPISSPVSAVKDVQDLGFTRQEEEQILYGTAAALLTSASAAKP